MGEHATGPSRGDGLEPIGWVLWTQNRLLYRNLWLLKKLKPWKEHTVVSQSQHSKIKKKHVGCYTLLES